MGIPYGGTPGLGSGGKLPFFQDSDWGDKAPVLNGANIGPGLRYTAGGHHPNQFAAHALLPTGGTVYGSRCFVPPGEVLTTVAVAVAVINVTPTAAENLIGIYSAAGNLLWVSSDQSANYTTLGINQLQLNGNNAPGYGDITVPSGSPWVDVVQLQNASTIAYLWDLLLVTLTPGVGCLAGTQTNGTATAWTGRTGATTLAATAGTQTGILTQLFAAVG